MPDPRNVISVESIDANYVTLNNDAVTIVFDITQIGGAALTTIGQAVSLSGNSTVQLCADGDGVLGKLIQVNNDVKCLVQFEGFARLPGGLAATLTLLSKVVGATGAAAARGFIRAVNTAVAAELGRAQGRIVDALDPTNVQVDF